MAVLSDVDLEKHVRFEPKLKETGPASQDLHIGQLYLPPKPRGLFVDPLTEDVSGPAEEFVKRLDKATLMRQGEDSFWIVIPGQYYLAMTVEKVTLPQGLGIEVATRSSWGRLGVRVRRTDSNDYAGMLEQRILLLIAAHDKPVFMRPNDRVCQAVVYDSLVPLFETALQGALEAGDIDCYINGTERTKAWNIGNHCLNFTMGSQIKRLDKDLIDPRQIKKDDYAAVEVPANGLDIGVSRFFLGTTRETVYVGPKHVGLLREPSNTPGRPRVHPNASVIDPGFNGTMTLQSYFPWPPAVVWPGRPFGELAIYPLTTLCKNPYKGGYQGAQGIAVRYVQQ